MGTVWRNLSFKTKLSFLIFTFTGCIVITALSYEWLVGEVRDIGVKQANATMLQGYRNELKDIVDVMALTLGSAIKNINDEDEIHEIFSTTIKEVRFFPDQSGYYFIYKFGGIVFAHAAQPHLEGKNLMSFKDAKGKLLIQELEKASRNGGGFVDYVWEKPHKGLQPKLSYSRTIPGTQYWIGTGVYIDDIEQQKHDILNNIQQFTSAFRNKLYIVLALCMLLIVGPMAWLLAKTIVTPILKLTEVANEYSRGNLDLQIPAIDRNDEIGKLAQSVDRLGVSIKLAMRKLHNKGE
jgi:signal transduction histidine kinase